ncbi:PREDICTED: organic cation transporter protein-like isoform X1 [Papilio polytes]|uniref:organic cation transporter protein-like isoform X1 n=2 Tax=Papilio polytes TaxID=76194 RepID=UPI0006764743|nr:PREDICTED: organic cation transporter protein-like isoform X1 [Papilio polytes]
MSLNKIFYDIYLSMKNFFKKDSETYVPIEKVNVDNTTSRIIGDFGRWQLKISILMSLIKLPMAWYQLNIIFMAPPQQFWCAKPPAFEEYTDEEWRKISVPQIMEYPCLIFDPDILLIAPKMDRHVIPLVACQKFVYDKTFFQRTLTSDFGLVCTKRWYINMSQCVMMTGIVVGGIVFGSIADKYGRKKPLMLAIVIQATGSYLVSFAPYYWSFLVVWFILAFGCGGIAIISFVICMEVVSGRWRTYIPVLYQLPFGLGNVVLALFSYWLRDWRKIEFALATVSLIYLLYWFWLPESPRWLLAVGKYDEAVEVLKKIVVENKRNVGDIRAIVALLPKKKKNDKLHLQFSDLIKSKNMRRKTIILSLIWFFTGLSYFTFSQYLGLIGSSIFLLVSMSGIISIPGGLLCLFILAKLGRKTTLNLFQILATVCFFAIYIFPKEDVKKAGIRLFFAGLGFAAIAGTVPALYLYSGELFPTVGRNVGVGGVTTFARIASMIAPLLVHLDVYIPGLPLLLVILISAGQVLLVFPLPETKNKPLPDSLEEAEQFR